MQCFGRTNLRTFITEYALRSSLSFAGFLIDLHIHWADTQTFSTMNLDSATTIEVMGLLKTSCRKYNQTILMVTHNEAIAQTCDRVIHIEDGQIVTGKRRFPAKGGDVVC